MIPNYMAFTKREGAIVDRLLTEVEIKYGTQSFKVVAQWDTGASGTCISKEVVSKLNLIPTGRKNILTPSGGDIVKTYVVDIILPNMVTIGGVPVIESAIGDQGIGALIGLDIICMGDFATTNKGKTTFSFVMPSIAEIDFVPKTKALNKAAMGHMKKRKKK